MSTPGATTEERKDGVVGWTKKLVLCLPLLYILVNALVQAREITDKLLLRYTVALMPLV